MNDYFDQLGDEIRRAASRRKHLPWYKRRGWSLQRPGLVAVIAALVIAPAALAAVGAAAGWFSPGKPDLHYPAAANSGIGKTVLGTRMLPIRVADPAGGPKWGLRLVKTNRNATCLQVGRVEYGELGSLGIDYSWGNDHKFHAINANEADADICGATDAAGHGFVTTSIAGWPASAYKPVDYGYGKAVTYCQASNPAAIFKQKLNRFPPGSRARKNLTKIYKRVKRSFARSKTHRCPAGSLRMIFTGLLGPDAKSITYKTPSGVTRTEKTVGGVGAYLVVFRQTKKDCNDFSSTLISRQDGCHDNYGGPESSQLRGPNAVISVTYKNGRTCSDRPSAKFAAAYKQFNAKSSRESHLTRAQRRAQFSRFLAAHHLTTRSWLQAVQPSCPLKGWVKSKQPTLTRSKVASPIKFNVIEAKHYCDNGPPSEAYKGKFIACNGAVPKGYRRYYLNPPGSHAPPAALVTITFTARQAASTNNSWYQYEIDNPGNNGGGGNGDHNDIRKGQRITFQTIVSQRWKGIYRGIITFEQNAGKQGFQNGIVPDRNGSLVVGRFSFRLPVK